MEQKSQQMELSKSLETASATIAARCYQDAAFARKLRENPRAAIEEACGKKLPESLAIEVHENDGRTWHVPLPDDTSAKLTDDQLSKVSGGFEIWVTCLIIGVPLAVGAVTGAVAGGIGAAQHTPPPD